MLLITGGAGFIGSNIATVLSNIGRHVIVCDRLRADGKWLNLAKTEIRDFIFPEELPNFLERRSDTISSVIHMGAISATSAVDGDEVIRNNFQFSTWLWDWCADREIPFIYASSAATYGNGEFSFSDDWSSDHLAQLRPKNLYGWSKHLFDRWVSRTYEEGKKCPKQWVGLKFFNVYGPNEYHKGTMQSVIPQFYLQLTQSKELRLFESDNAQYPHGGQLRDFVYVKDCVKVLIWMLENPHISGIFNVGTGEARSFNELATLIISISGFEGDIKYIKLPIELKGKYQYYTQATTSRLNMAGFSEPFISIEEGVTDYLTNYLMTMDPYV